MKTKQQRQHDTAAMKRCECGNIARLEQDMCGRCIAAEAAEAARRERFREREASDAPAWYNADNAGAWAAGYNAAIAELLNDEV